MSINIIHTSDWHLGKKFFGHSRLSEQISFLEWLEQKVYTEDIHVLIVSGDIFDTPHPPDEALSCYFNFLAKIAKKKDLEIFICSGNHDSAKFLYAPDAFLSEKNIHIGHTLSDNVYRIEREGELLQIVMLPYFRTHEIYHFGKKILSSKMEEETISAYFQSSPSEFIQETLSLYVQGLNLVEEGPKLLVAHHQFGSFHMSGSEMNLSVCGIESLPINLFERFDYLALGHIHRHQVIKKEYPYAVYSGSPIKFRYSENDDKSLMKITQNQNKLSFLKQEIPSSNKVQHLELNEKNYVSIIDEFLTGIKNLTNSSFVELEVISTLNGPDIVQYAKDSFQNKNIIVTNVKSLLEGSDKDQDEDNEIENYEIGTLINHYLEDKSLVPQEITQLKNEFYQLIERIETNSDIRESYED